MEDTMDAGRLIDLDRSPLFTRWTDPASGVTSHILTRRVAPIQQSFYFVNQPFSDDGQYLWFYCAHPPAGNAEVGRTLGVADLMRHDVRWFPETQFSDASPFVDGTTGFACWCSNYAVYRRGPAADAPTCLVNAVPENIHKQRSGARLATHLTLSSDRKEFFIDAHFGREWIAGSLPVDGGEFQTWQVFNRCYNHAQFSPTDPDLALIARDWWIDVASGVRYPCEDRLWLLRRGERAVPMFTVSRPLTHEWWDPSGESIWYVDTSQGTENVDIRSGAVTNVWPNGTCHSHASATGAYLVGDIGTYSWARSGCRVAFFNTRTGREINIVSALPPRPASAATYHVDPHPRFCLNDACIVYTTTVLGTVDVAMAKTQDLIDATG